MKKYDYLVIGSGIAGLTFALKAAELGKVAVITKQKLYDCNTDYAQGGIAAVINQQDSFAQHVTDTFNAGNELGKLPVIQKIVETGPQIIEFLISHGTEFTVKNKNETRSMENLSLSREGAHTHHRVAYAADSTGHMIMSSLVRACQNHPKIDIFEHHMAIDLITQHHIPQLNEFIPRITCWGAYVLDTLNNEVQTFRATKTMLATGGGSQVYSNTTNPDIATGDGYAMARLAGARLANMEFIQFHPTSFYSLAGKTFLISEALRGEGAVLTLQNGEEFMQKYHSLGSLAPRDVVARAIETELNTSNDKYVYLDARVVDRAVLKEHFPYIDKKLTKHGIDFTHQPIPVVPAAHYFCGGVVADSKGRTDIKNLFVAGEVACSGMNGSNRLASNSLLEGAAMAWNAVNHSINDMEVDFPDIPDWQNVGNFNENEWVIISHNREIIKTIMHGYVGIKRSKRLLKYARDRIHNILTEINNFYQHNPVRAEVIETRNMAITASVIILSALRRKESRGLHYIVDYPDKIDSYKKDTIV